MKTWMKTMTRALIPTVVATAAILLTTQTAFAQGRGGRGGDPNWPPPGSTPRTADGHPDLTGNWQPNAIGQNVDMIRAGVEVPMLPAAKEIYDKRKAARRPAHEHDTVSVELPADAERDLDRL
jgi:hypothetical protein